MPLWQFRDLSALEPTTIGASICFILANSLPQAGWLRCVSSGPVAASRNCRIGAISRPCTECSGNLVAKSPIPSEGNRGPALHWASRGGNPLIEEGKSIGAIGCSGGAGSQDEAVCTAAAAAINK
jgi:hypothetical protein